MSKKETDISLIRKYLNGELDAKAMHRLERRAQEDPFLMDALEGYESAGGDQHSQLDDLADRLNQRVEKKVKRLLPLRFIAIAASVLIVFTAGGLWFFNQPTASYKSKALVKTEIIRPPVAHEQAAPSPSEKATALNKQPAKQLLERVKRNNAPPPIVSADAMAVAPVRKATIANANIKDSVPKDTTPVDEAIVMAYSSPKPKDKAKKAVTVTDTNANNVKLLQGQVDGVAANNKTVSREANSTILPVKTPQHSLNEIQILNKSKAYSNGYIKGTVIAKDDGMPLPGVSVRVAGTNKATQTDTNGQFNLPVDSGKTKLVLAYIGYQTLEVSARNRDSIKTFSLQPTNSSLNEVVVTGYTSRNADVNDTVIDARPQEGWTSFRKYLKENAISPDNKTGVVRLSFDVDRNGVVSNIKVLKGLSTATDQKATDLVKNGPGWVGSTSGKTEKVRLRVKFGK